MEAVTLRRAWRLLIRIQTREGLSVLRRRCAAQAFVLTFVMAGEGGSSVMWLRVEDKDIDAAKLLRVTVNENTTGSGRKRPHDTLLYRRCIRTRRCRLLSIRAIV